MMQDWEIDEYALIRVRKQRDRLLTAAKVLLIDLKESPGDELRRYRCIERLAAAVKEVEG